MTKRLSSLSGLIRLVLFFQLVFCKVSAQELEQPWYRGDQHISFAWRYGYSEFPMEASATAQEDALRGKFGWYDGALWSQAYTGWDGSVIHGVQLLFRGGSPYAREVKCTSALVPYKAAGTPVSFLIPFLYTIGSEEEMAFSLRIKGAAEEAIVCKLRPQPVTSFTGGMFKVTFVTLKVTSPAGNKPLVTVSGMMHIRVYPALVAYGDRTTFIFSSVTRHMDVESSLVLGSVYKDLSQADPYQLAEKLHLSADTISAATQRHDDRLRQWRQSTAKISEALIRKGKVEVFCAGATEKRDRGELRVTAYSGNPVKDFQYGQPSPQMKEMAQTVTNALGKRFSLFRYQHHYLPWKLESPAELDSGQVIYLKQWLEVAGAYADSVLLDLQISPIIKLYKQYSQSGQLALPPTGIPGAEWDKIRQGYLTTIQYAKQVCPSLKIIQMPYELDNMANTSVHADAHYRFFQCLYEAVSTFNKQQPAANQLKIAGLGNNNPNSRWEFIKGFLRRYGEDTSEKKRLDYITWHTYLFPGNYPAMVKGVADSLRRLLNLYQLNEHCPVIIDEMGLAEPSTIEDLSDLQGALQKEAAMASFTTVLQDYYEKEQGTFIPISGAGWHFALLTYGKQPVLSTYAKGLILRSKLGEWKIPVKATPVDASGYGLHAIATKENNRISILLYCASPSIFYSHAAPLNYPDIELVLNNLPAGLRNTPLKITQWYTTPDNKTVQKILSQDKYQTLPLTRGADRYEKEFSPEEIKLLNQIDQQTSTLVANKSSLSLSVNLDAYGMRLIEIEPASVAEQHEINLPKQPTNKKKFSILGLGDSITEGGPEFFSYLFPLDSLLKQAGYQPRFIGPRYSVQQGDTLYHAGFSGKTAEFLAARIDSIYSAFPADLVLLHAGHNHFQEETPVPGILQAQRTIIQTIKKKNPHARILVAGVITSGKLPKYEYIPELDARLQKMVDSLQDASVVFVDQRNGWNWTNHTIHDKVHPNRIGASIIANNWFNAMTSAQTDSLLPAKEFSARGGLPNFFSKIKSGKPVKVAFLGGSITRAGNGYRDQIMNWFSNQFPANRFEEIMAAVSGTGSDFGACRVQQHVIDHQPDLVFVEFAVNDNRMRMQLVRETMEGIVRQIWKANHATDICFIYTFSAENLPVLQKGLFPASVSAMEAVASHYNIPAIHMGLAVIDEIEKGKLLMSGKKEEPSTVPLFSYDGVHPLPETGHTIYTQVLARNLSLLLLLKENAVAAKHVLPPAFEKQHWDKAGMIRLPKHVQFSGDWTTTDSVTKGKEYFQLLPQVYATASDNASMTVRFEGTRFGLADIMGPGTTAIEVTIDNQPPRIINRFDAFCTYYRLNYFILSDLPPGKHTATIRIAPGQIDKAAILKTRNVVVKDWSLYEGRAMYVGAILY